MNPPGMGRQAAELYGLLLGSPSDEALALALCDLLEREGHGRMDWAHGRAVGYASFDACFGVAARIARGAGGEVYRAADLVIASDNALAGGPAALYPRHGPHPGLANRPRAKLVTRGPFVREAHVSRNVWRLAGPSLVAAEPVTWVRLADANPYRAAPYEWLWYGDDPDVELEDGTPDRWQDATEHWLPGELVGLMAWDAARYRFGTIVSTFRTEGEAITALSNAALAWARRNARDGGGIQDWSGILAVPRTS